MSVTEHRGVSLQAAVAIAGARLFIKPLVALYPVRAWSFGPLAGPSGSPTWSTGCPAT